MATITGGVGLGGLNFDNLDIGSLPGATVLESSATLYRADAEDDAGVGRHVFTGTGFTYDSLGRLSGGTVTGYQRLTTGDALVVDVTGINVDVPSFLGLGAAHDTPAAWRALLVNGDSITGTALDDVLKGYAGGDSISAGAGSDTIDGGAGANYLRGDDGADSMVGGSGFNDMNGNMGADTVSGGSAGDWVVGGKDNDILGGEGGNDIVYGNLGDDWCDGGDGADLVRGGQGDDVLYGRAGDDWLSGDRGSDTLTGGLGADVFHTFNEAGIDRVVDFNRAEGDRVELDPGTTYTVSQVIDDVVIDMGGGNQMILVGVQMSSLTGAWIFGA